MFQSVFCVVMMMSGQLAFQTEPPTDTLQTPRFLDSSEQPPTSLQAPAQIAEPEPIEFSRSPDAAP